MNRSIAEIELELEKQADIHATIEVKGDVLVITGLIASEEERQAALEIVTELAPEKEIEDNLDLLTVLPEEIEGLSLSEAEAGDFPTATPNTEDNEALEPGDFTDQKILENPGGAAGPAGTAVDEEISEGESVYVPPTDPVRTRDNEFLGGFQTTAMDEVQVDAAVSGGIPDEAIADAVRRELLEDAATTALEIEVTVNRGIVFLRGRVADIDDAENVEAVALRVPGVVEVVEELDVADM
jgi:osmotically-inducible protein OsmY